MGASTSPEARRGPRARYILAVVLGLAMPAMAPPEPAFADLFDDNCVGCHGAGGMTAVSNGIVLGARVAGGVLSRGTFELTVTNGRGGMPCFGSEPQCRTYLESRQIGALYDFLAAGTGDEPADNTPVEPPAGPMAAAPGAGESEPPGDEASSGPASGGAPSRTFNLGGLAGAVSNPELTTPAAERLAAEAPDAVLRDPPMSVETRRVYENGRRWYEARCATCHGSDLMGSERPVPAGLADDPQYTRARRPLYAMFSQTPRRYAPSFPEDDRYGSSIRFNQWHSQYIGGRRVFVGAGDPDQKAVFTYINRYRAPGVTLYANFCSNCHQPENGAGGPSPVPDYLRASSLVGSLALTHGEFRQVLDPVSHPCVSSTWMPFECNNARVLLSSHPAAAHDSFVHLNDVDIHNIYAYLCETGSPNCLDRRREANRIRGEQEQLWRGIQEELARKRQERLRQLAEQRQREAEEAEREAQQRQAEQERTRISVRSQEIKSDPYYRALDERACAPYLDAARFSVVGQSSDTCRYWKFAGSEGRISVWSPHRTQYLRWLLDWPGNLNQVLFEVDQGMERCFVPGLGDIAPSVDWQCSSQALGSTDRELQCPEGTSLVRVERDGNDVEWTCYRGDIVRFNEDLRWLYSDGIP